MEREFQNELAAIAEELRRHALWARSLGESSVPVSVAVDLPKGATPVASASPERAPAPVAEARPAAPPRADRPIAASSACIRCGSPLDEGIGSGSSGLLFVADGKPARGGSAKADELLAKMIAAMGQSKETIHLLALGACDGSADRAEGSCLHWLDRRVESLRPRVVVALGQRVAQSLLRSDAPITELRGRFHDFGGIPLMPTFHPAWLLRRASDKALAWEDLKQVMAKLRRA